MRLSLLVSQGQEGLWEDLEPLEKFLQRLLCASKRHTIASWPAKVQEQTVQQIKVFLQLSQLPPSPYPQFHKSLAQLSLSYSNS